MISTARISDDGVYRYELTRIWGDGPRALFCMLNASTADAVSGDRTIGRCTGFAELWRLSGLHVVNIFAYRSRDPRALLDVDDPVGPDNDEAIDAALRDPLNRVIVAAWGAHVPRRYALREHRLAKLFSQAGAQHLGLTASGHPMHPLYRPADTPLRPFIYPRDASS